jgi:hypothetical protein
MSRASALCLLCAAAALAGCESTQDKSARLEAQAATLADPGKGLVVGERSRDVLVERAVALQDANGTAVVVELRNRSRRALAGVPVALDLRGRGERELYANDAPGLDASLVRVPLIGARERLSWVNDQVTASERPRKVRARVGADARAVSGDVPRIELRGVRLQRDPVSGVAAVGNVVNRSQVEQRRLIVFAVARRGSRIAAAGRAIVERLRPGKTVRFTAFFIGDPRGARLEVAAPPTATR